MLKTIDGLEKRKEALYNKYYDSFVKMYEKELIDVLKWFKAKFPKKVLKWHNGMGTQFWTIDGEIFDCDVFIPESRSQFSKTILLKERGWTRKEIILTPLVCFYHSITDGTYMPSSGVDVRELSTNDI